MEVTFKGMRAASIEENILATVSIGVWPGVDNRLAECLTVVLGIAQIAAAPWMHVIRLSEHGDCAEVMGILRNTRTVPALSLIRQLNWNMYFHAEHHALASVPFHRLAAAHSPLKTQLAEQSSGYAHDLVAYHAVSRELVMPTPR